jgi:hypothetical protein
MSGLVFFQRWLHKPKVRLEDGERLVWADFEGLSNRLMTESDSQTESVTRIQHHHLYRSKSS